MHPVACPSISHPQRLKNNQRLAELRTILQRPIQRKVVLQPPVRNHPIQNVIARRIHSLPVALANPKLRRSAHHTLPTRVRLCRPSWFSPSFPACLDIFQLQIQSALHLFSRTSRETLSRSSYRYAHANLTDHPL